MRAVVSSLTNPGTVGGGGSSKSESGVLVVSLVGSSEISGGTAGPDGAAGTWGGTGIIWIVPTLIGILLSLGGGWLPRTYSLQARSSTD